MRHRRAPASIPIEAVLKQSEQMVAIAHTAIFLNTFLDSTRRDNGAGAHLRSNLAHPRPGTRETRALELLLSYSFFYCPRLRLIGAERASRIRWIYGEAATRTSPTACSLRRYAPRKRPNKKKTKDVVGRTTGREPSKFTRLFKLHETTSRSE